MLRDALDTALGAITHEPQDAAVVALARLYADRIDQPDDVEPPADDRQAHRGQPADNLKSFGPPLLAVLKELRMTPASRGAATEGGAPSNGEPDHDEIDELEARRADRRRASSGQHDTPPVD